MHPAPVTYVHAVWLGLLQGLTEFLPVSSTAHMDVVPQLFHQRDPGAAFSAIAQLGPIIAIVLYFWSDIGRYIKGIIRTRTPRNVAADDLDARLGWYTLLGTIPIIIFGVLLEKKIDTSFRRLPVVAASLILLGLVLWVSEIIGKKRTKLDQMTMADSQVVGWAQVLALVPGASRSGVTITAGLFRNFDRETAARFSFLLSIPAITAAGLYKLLKSLKAGGLAGAAGPGIVAAVVAGLLAYVVIRWFLGYMKEHNTGIFIAYRILAGLAILWLLHAGTIKEKPVKRNAAVISAARLASRPPNSAPLRS
ncbi:MAG: undecaprenyl-diphosphatase UppP [Armatimonadetes bacterium]|nr:undecaprenyl-diphosphatase UppP [Armatimonadota bacterium]MDE2207412.1 undecaprenyl-diphosphatase UppP [Armatimonadota bacterium]